MAVADPTRRPQVALHRGRPARPPRHPGSPDPADLAAVREFVRTRERPTAIDMFCGAGGLSLGLDQAGFDVIVGADSDAWSIRTHEANVPGLSWHGDLADPDDFLRALDVWGIDRVDLVAGGVPCQPFSRAGQSRIRQLVKDGERSGHDSRVDLWASFIAVVRRLNPCAVLVENVPDLPRWNDGEVLIALFSSLRELGYTVDARVLDGFRHGVPQHRQRLILIGLRDGRTPSWPAPQDSLVSLRDAIGDLPPIPRAQRAEELPYDARRATSPFQRLMRRGLKGGDRAVITEHICRDVREDDMEAFRLLDPGGTYADLPERLQRYRSDMFTDKYKRLSWPELSRTITAHIAKDGYWYIHPDQHRTLSIREAARIQTFPDDFRFAGAQTHRYRQIGNAVPPLLGRAVGEAVMHCMTTESSRDAEHHDVLRERLLGWHAGVTDSPPWRRGAEPWHVLAAELGISRMRARDTLEAYPRLVAVASTPAALLAHSDPVARLRELGLKEGAARVVAVARALVAGHGGTVPDSEEALLGLPGVGDFVARAVLCFGFARSTVLYDNTTARVARRLGLQPEAGRHQLRVDLYRLSGTPGPDPGFNRALLDLGRTICRTESPQCALCPLASVCTTATDPAASDVIPLRIARGSDVQEPLPLASGSAAA